MWLVERRNLLRFEPFPEFECGFGGGKGSEVLRKRIGKVDRRRLFRRRNRLGFDDSRLRRWICEDLGRKLRLGSRKWR